MQRKKRAHPGVIATVALTLMTIGVGATVADYQDGPGTVESFLVDPLTTKASRTGGQKVVTPIKLEAVPRKIVEVKRTSKVVKGGDRKGFASLGSLGTRGLVHAIPDEYEVLPYQSKERWHVWKKLEATRIGSMEP